MERVYLFNISGARPQVVRTSSPQALKAFPKLPLILRRYKREITTKNLDEGEHDMDGERVINFIAGLLSGAIVGAAVAILLAPQSGTEIRKGVTDKVNQLIALGRQARSERRQELQAQYTEAIQIPLPPQEEART
jgi:hypothetical protein